MLLELCYCDADKIIVLYYSSFHSLSDDQRNAATLLKHFIDLTNQVGH